jgi:iron complex outermembrane receptor protein
MTTPNALTYNSRKSVKQTQAGLTYERELGAARRCASWPMPVSAK